MTIEKLSECNNASKYGTCTECGISEGESYNLYRLKSNGVSVCLCQDCFLDCFFKTRMVLNNVILIWRGEAESEDKE